MAEPVPAPLTTTSVVVAGRGPRRWVRGVSRLWRQSLRFRTTLVAVLSTVVAITIACVWMAAQIQSDLFESRGLQVQSDAARAIQMAQDELDSGQLTSERSTLEGAISRAYDTLVEQSRTTNVAYLRIDSTPMSIAPTDGGARTLPTELISPGLRERVSTSEQQWWQSVELRAEDGSVVPGIIVGQQLNMPYVGPYAVFFGYGLADSEETLGFVQRTLWIAGAVLVLIVGLVTWLVLRSVADPIIEVARTSRQLADGDLEVRIPVQGEDELAALGASFNQMADSIESQINELAELSLVQQRFVSDVSHELRTPLTTIRLAAEMINDQRDELDPSMSRAAELLYTQVARFEELLTDLLEISRYDAGSVQLEREPTALTQLTEDVVDGMRQLADQRGSELHLVTPGGHTPVDMDPRRVRRILRNLLGNAIEHGEGRPIIVTVDSDAHAVAVGVRDHGLGMSADDSQRVFDRFWRADPSRKRTLGGTGLGLSIALGDATLHGGTLAVSSELGRGTNFVLTLPRRVGEEIAGEGPVRLVPDEDQPYDDAFEVDAHDATGGAGAEDGDGAR